MVVIGPSKCETVMFVKIDSSNGRYCLWLLCPWNSGRRSTVQKIQTVLEGEW